jgi:hypothetical protein
MSINNSVLTSYLYLLAVYGSFVYNCIKLRSWIFVRVTVLYYIFITFFACLLIYGSAYHLDSHLTQLSREGLFSEFPFRITGDSPNLNTVSVKDPNYFKLLFSIISFYVTFPQAAIRAARLRPNNTIQPEEAIETAQTIWEKVNVLFNFIKPTLLGTLSEVYIVGEWIFVLITISSLVSPFPMQSWYLMLIGCFFVILLSGADIISGVDKLPGTNGILMFVLRAFVPGVVSFFQKIFLRVFTAIFIVLAIGVLGVYLFSGYLIFNIIGQAMHAKDPVMLAKYVVTGCMILGLNILLYFSIVFSIKLVIFTINKLLEWMEIKVLVDPEEFKLFKK